MNRCQIKVIVMTRRRDSLLSGLFGLLLLWFQLFACVSTAAAAATEGVPALPRSQARVAGWNGFISAGNAAVNMLMGSVLLSTFSGSSATAETTITAASAISGSSTDELALSLQESSSLSSSDLEMNAAECKTSRSIVELERMISEGQLESIANGLLDILEECPDHQRANALMGATLLAMQKPKLAEEVLYSAIAASNWTDLMSISNLAEAFRLNGEVDMSTALAQRGLHLALKMNRVRESASLRFILGMTAISAGNYSIAADWFLSSASLDTKNTDAWIRASSLLFPPSDRNSKLALTVLSKACELNPDDTDLLYHFGIALHLNNRVEDAIAVYESALRLLNVVSSSLPIRKANILTALGTAYYATKRERDALVTCEQAFQKGARDAAFLSNYATMLCSSDTGSEIKSQGLALLSTIDETTFTEASEQAYQSARNLCSM